MPSVLIVDDDPSVRSALRKLLERAGLTASEAASTDEALALLHQAPPDAVVCDVFMPGRNGLALYDAIVARAPSLAGHVVFLTGAANDPIVHGAIEQRGVPLVSKMDDLHLVVDAVRVALLRP